MQGTKEVNQKGITPAKPVLSRLSGKKYFLKYLVVL